LSTDTTNAAAVTPPEDGAPLLTVENLRVNFYTSRGQVHAVRDVSFRVQPGTALGIVGESGSGKSVTAMSLMGLVGVPGRVDGGTIRWRSKDVTDPRELRRLRGRHVTMVFQDPMTSLNPLVTVGRQITEVLRKHKGMQRDAARRRAVELLELVGIPFAKDRLKQFPHELSGGLRQRVMIAIALAPDPELLIADEPTTALDVTIQAQILELIAELQRTLNLTMILITHDLGVVAGVCDQVAVMYAGRIVEQTTTSRLYARPSHPYSAALLGSTPRVDRPTDRLTPIGGSPPSAMDIPEGCAFAVRCHRSTEECVRQRPELEPVEDGHEAACWHAG
jgi:peptide/nickel transport system ATP-binding protein